MRVDDDMLKPWSVLLTNRVEQRALPDLEPATSLFLNCSLSISFHSNFLLMRRFIELHIGEIPAPEWAEIIHRKCSLPLRYASKLVDVMIELQRVRLDSHVFAGNFF